MWQTLVGKGLAELGLRRCHRCGGALHLRLRHFGQYLFQNDGPATILWTLVDLKNRAQHVELPQLGRIWAHSSGIWAKSTFHASFEFASHKWRTIWGGSVGPNPIKVGPTHRPNSPGLDQIWAGLNRFRARRTPPMLARFRRAIRLDHTRAEFHQYLQGFRYRSWSNICQFYRRMP